MKPNETLLYAATSANLYNFMGNSEFDTHLDVFKTILKSSSKAFADLFNFSVDDVQLLDKDNVMPNLETHPRIFVSFHAGSYYTILGWLLKAGHEVLGMSDTQSIASGDFANLTELYRQQYGNNCRLDMVNVEEQGAIFDLIRKLKRGVIVLAYIDGNKGVGGQTKDNENMVSIDFLNGRVKVRKGIAYLSYLTKVPVQVALNHFDENGSWLKIYENHAVPHTLDKEEFAKEVMKYVFGCFEDYLGNYWMQWANWPYVHNWSLIDYFRETGTQTSDYWITINDKWKLNTSRYCPLKLDDGLFLFDRLRYSLLPIEKQYAGLFSYKSSINEKQSMLEQIIRDNDKMAESLVSRDILAVV